MDDDDDDDDDDDEEEEEEEEEEETWDLGLARVEASCVGCVPINGLPQRRKKAVDILILKHRQRGRLAVEEDFCLISHGNYN